MISSQKIFEVQVNLTNQSTLTTIYTDFNGMVNPFLDLYLSGWSKQAQNEM